MYFLQIVSCLLCKDSWTFMGFAVLAVESISGLSTTLFSSEETGTWSDRCSGMFPPKEIREWMWIHIASNQLFPTHMGQISVVFQAPWNRNLERQIPKPISWVERSRLHLEIASPRPHCNTLLLMDQFIYAWRMIFLPITTSPAITTPLLLLAPSKPTWPSSRWTSASRSSSRTSHQTPALVVYGTMMIMLCEWEAMIHMELYRGNKATRGTGASATTPPHSGPIWFSTRPTKALIVYGPQLVGVLVRHR